MAIDKVRVVSITSSETGAGADFFCNFYVKVNGDIIGSTEARLPSQNPGGATQHDIPLRFPKNAADFSDDCFSFDIDAGGDINNKWLPSAIYVFGLDEGRWKLLSSVMDWPGVWVGAGGSISEYNLVELNS